LTEFSFIIAVTEKTVNILYHIKETRVSETLDRSPKYDTQHNYVQTVVVLGYN
jgi:hypothetical protein